MLEKIYWVILSIYRGRSGNKSKLNILDTQEKELKVFTLI